jgi:hypothetical protein
LYGRNNAPLARFDTFTGGGLLPSSTWQPGQMWVDEMDLRIPDDAETPAVLRLQFALFSTYFGDFATNIDASGNATSPLFEGATLLPATQPLNAQPLATFGDIVRLNAAEVAPMRAGAPLTVTLQWQPMGKAQQDYTVFAHLLDANGQLVAQNDSPPDAGQFASTRWASGATFTETRVLAVPANARAGDYRLSVGLYDPKTVERLPALNAQGATLPDSRYTTDAFALNR